MGKKKSTSISLSRGRPPTLRQNVRSISHKETRALINAHHTLHKKRQQALARNDGAAAATLDSEIEALGGIEEYQRASLQGQRNDRGGDSSKILLEWMRPAYAELKKFSGEQQFRMLEVGALSTENACTRSRMFHVEHIDLNSQQPGILQQDFMERPLPQSDEERFEAISLSLVLNYVPDPSLRGQMLWRTVGFLRQPRQDVSDDAHGLFPCLFLVLPRSCITNSRYFSKDRMTELMSLLGYVEVEMKYTNKLVYSLWKRFRPPRSPLPPFVKKEVNPGPGRNNFTVILKST